MEIVIFIFYLLLISFLITFIPFFKKSGIGKWTLIALFLIKVLAGISYGLFYTLPKYYPGSDTWRFYRLSLEETKWLLHNPAGFIKDLFTYGYASSGNLFSGENTYWNDLKSNLPVKIMAVLNLLTHNSYYTNIILFNLLFITGLVALFKTFYTIFPSKKWVIIFGIFLLPSTLFWCSGIHKDGLILSATGFIIFVCFKFFTGKVSFKNMSTLLLCALLIFSLRNYVLFALLPVIFCWMLCEKYPGKRKLIFFGVYITGIFLFFIVPYIFPSVNPPAYFALKQHEFLLLSAGSEVKAFPLQPNFAGFISFLPHAVDMAFFRPHVTEVYNISYIPAIGETLFLVFLTISSFFFINRKKETPSIVPSLLMFAITILLICGYTIPFTGAIVRYRSLVLPFLITPLLCISDFSVLKKGDQLQP